MELLLFLVIRFSAYIHSVFILSASIDTIHHNF